jgi:hypothetical protein
LLSFALLIIGIKNCLENRKPIIIKRKIIIDILFLSNIAIIKPVKLKTRPKDNILGKISLEI